MQETMWIYKNLVVIHCTWSSSISSNQVCVYVCKLVGHTNGLDEMVDDQVAVVAMRWGSLQL